MKYFNLIIKYKRRKKTAKGPLFEKVVGIKTSFLEVLMTTIITNSQFKRQSFFTYSNESNLPFL